MGLESTYLIAKISAVLSFLSFNRYLIISLFFCVYSFLGAWYFYKLMVYNYPSMYKSLALGILFFPSTVFWGSGLLKDSLTFGSLCFFCYAFANLFIYKRKIVLSVVLLLLSGYLIMVIKLYILLILIPALLTWKSLLILKKTPKFNDKVIIGIFVILFSVAAGSVLVKSLASGLERYAVENIIENMVVHQTHLIKATQKSSGAGAGITKMHVDASLGTIIRQFPSSVILTLYRPFLWEVRKLVVAISGLENFIILLISLFIIIRLGISKLVKAILRDPILIMSLIFVLSFSFIVGFTTPNFGSLVRYKIPMLPFYATILVVLFHLALKKNF